MIEDSCADHVRNSYEEQSCYKTNRNLNIIANIKVVFVVKYFLKMNAVTYIYGSTPTDTLYSSK